MIRDLHRLDWDDDEITRRSINALDAAGTRSQRLERPSRNSLFAITGGKSAPALIAELGDDEISPDSEIRSTGDYPCSAPIPLAEDQRETTKNRKRSLPPRRPTLPQVTRQPPAFPPPASLRPGSRAPMARLPASSEAPSSLPPDTEPSIQQVAKPMVQRQSAPAVVVDPALEAEVARLRRWLKVSLTLAISALVATLALASYILMPLAGATLSVDAPAAIGAWRHVAVAPPTANFTPELPGPQSPAASDEVEVVITLLTPGASVLLTKFGQNPELLPGPWPRSIHLPPGKYNLAATKAGNATFMRLLDLSLDRPRREVAIVLR